ncbi:unnamed protein product, partial [Rotaria socialis]
MAYAAYPSTASSRQVMPARRYQIREKIFSIGDNFKIKDEAGQDVYTVRSKLFSLGDKLVLEDIAGNGEHVDLNRKLRSDYPEVVGWRFDQLKP